MREPELILGLICLIGLWLIIALIRANMALAAARDARSENDRLKEHLRQIRLRLDALVNMKAPEARPPPSDTTEA